MLYEQDIFLKKTELEIKNYDLLKTIFSKIYEIEKDLAKKRSSTFDNILDIPEPDNDTLRNIYGDFTKEMKNLEGERNNLVIRIKSDFIPSIINNCSKAKMEKKRIAHYTSKKTENAKKQYEIEKAQATGNALKESQLNQDIAKNKKEINDFGESIQKNLMKFEKERISDNKFMILLFIHNELAYHTKAVEKLSELYKKVKNSEPKADLKKFVDKLNFKNVNLEDYGYVENKVINKGKSTIKVNNLGDSNKSLRISGLNSKKGMLQNSKLSEIQDDLQDDLEDLENI